jgi:LPS sulfotransferase NodH
MMSAQDTYRRATGKVLTVLAVAVVESPIARRFAHTSIGRELRASRIADRAIRSLKDRHRMAVITRSVVLQHRLGRREPYRAAAAGGTTARGRAPEAAVTPFLILSSPRSGSTLVKTELARRWPEIRCLNEEYSRAGRLGVPPETTDEVTARVFAATNGQLIVGCKLFYAHVTVAEVQLILTMPGMKVLHLRRRNILRRYVSLQIARTNNVWSRHPRQASPNTDDRAVTVDVDDFIDDSFLAVERQRQVEQVVAAAGVDVLDVWYEDLSEHLDAELRRMACFLGAGAPAYESEPVMARQNPEPLRLLIRNYAEVHRRLSRTPMRVYLDPETQLGVHGATERIANRTRSGRPSSRNFWKVRGIRGIPWVSRSSSGGT